MSKILFFRPEDFLRILDEHFWDRFGSELYKLTLSRLRQTDVKAGHFERKVQALENERDNWETKYEEMAKKYAAVQKELEDFQQEISNI